MYIYTKISLTEIVNGLVLLILPIYFNALERTTVLGSLHTLSLIIIPIGFILKSMPICTFKIYNHLAESYENYYMKLPFSCDVTKIRPPLFSSSRNTLKCFSATSESKYLAAAGPWSCVGS